MVNIMSRAVTCTDVVARMHITTATTSTPRAIVTFSTNSHQKTRSMQTCTPVVMCNCRSHVWGRCLVCDGLDVVNSHDDFGWCVIIRTKISLHEISKNDIFPRLIVA